MIKSLCGIKLFHNYLLYVLKVNQIFSFNIPNGTKMPQINCEKNIFAEDGQVGKEKKMEKE